MKANQNKPTPVNLDFLKKGSAGMSLSILFVSIARVYPSGNTRALLVVLGLSSLLYGFFWFYQAGRRFLFELIGEVISIIIMSLILIAPGLLAIYFILGEDFLNDHENVGALMVIVWLLAAIFTAIAATYAIENKIKSKS